MLEEQYRKWQQELEPEPEVEEGDAPISLFDFIGPPPQPLGGVCNGAAGKNVEEAGAEAAAEEAEFGQRYKVVLEPIPTVSIFDGDHPTPIGAYQRTSILLMTPERLDLCLRHPSTQSAGSWLRSVGICVVDEVQTIEKMLRTPDF